MYEEKVKNEPNTSKENDMKTKTIFLVSFAFAILLWSSWSCEFKFQLHSSVPNFLVQFNIFSCIVTS